MVEMTEQIKKWAGQFGQDYTDRNETSLEGMEIQSRKDIGVTRADLNEHFLRGIDQSARILEVGCNIGNQLLCLQKMGFNNLWGVDVQDYALKLARGRSEGIRFTLASALDLPFGNDYFDLVFTSGVLIHIGPLEIAQAMAEIHRCSRRYIWGSEHYADEDTEIFYRGHWDLLWNRDFAQLYLDQFSDLSLVDEVRFLYQGTDDKNTMFLLEKG